MTRRFFPWNKPSTPQCPAPPPCPAPNLEPVKQKAVEEERRRILAFINGAPEPEPPPPTQPEPEPALHPDVILLRTPITNDSMKVDRKLATEFYLALTNNEIDRFKEVIGRYRKNFLYENMKALRRFVTPHDMYPYHIAILIPSVSMFKKLNETKELDDTIKDLVKNVIDVPFTENGVPMLDKNGKVMSLRSISEKNKAAFEYFNRLLPQTGGRTRKRKPRRRKSRKH